MARRKRRGGRRGMLSKVGRKIASAGGSLMISGPVWLPAALAASDSAGLAGFPQNYVYQATGFNMSSGKLDQGQLVTVVTRDAVLVGFGIFAKWLAKRA